jgi:hypothetical protein
MGRKIRNPDDSLEMLLDTMCNAFGGIILIAILIALLARDADVDDDPKLIEERAKLEHRRLAKTLKKLEFTEESKDAEARTIDTGITNLVNQMEGIQDDVTTKTNLVAQLAKTPEEVAETSRDIMEQERKNGELTGQLNTAQMERTEWEKKAGKAKNGNAITIRAPSAEETALKQAILVFQHGKFWAIHTFDEDGEPQLNRVAVQQQGAKMTPKPQAGSPVPAHPDQMGVGTPIGNYLKAFPKGKAFCKMFIHKNSFKEGRMVKTLLAAKGIRYNWIPIVEDIEFSAGGSGTGTVQ